MRSGEPLKMATVGVEGRLPPTQKIEQLSDNLTALLPRLSVRISLFFLDLSFVFGYAA